MAAQNLSATGAKKSRKAIPKDVRAEYKRLYGVSHEAILVVPTGTSKAQAKALHGQWLAEVETRIERIRAAARGEGQPLTKLNALALAGQTETNDPLGEPIACCGQLTRRIVVGLLVLCARAVDPARGLREFLLRTFGFQQTLGWGMRGVQVRHHPTLFQYNVMTLSDCRAIRQAWAECV
jgi:hypothetical protein